MAEWCVLKAFTKMFNNGDFGDGLLACSLGRWRLVRPCQAQTHQRCCSWMRLQELNGIMLPQMATGR